MDQTLVVVAGEARRYLEEAVVVSSMDHHMRACDLVRMDHRNDVVVDGNYDHSCRSLVGDVACDHNRHCVQGVEVVYGEDRCTAVGHPCRHVYRMAVICPGNLHSEGLHQLGLQPGRVALSVPSAYRTHEILPSQVDLLDVQATGLIESMDD